MIGDSDGGNLGEIQGEDQYADQVIDNWKIDICKELHPDIGLFLGCNQNVPVILGLTEPPRIDVAKLLLLLLFGC